MWSAPVTRRGIQNLSRTAFCERDELLYRSCRERRMDREHTWLAAEHSDGCKILQGVVRQLLVQMRVTDVRRGMHHQCVTIRRRFGNHVRTDRSCCPRAIIDDELLARGLR